MKRQLAAYAGTLIVMVGLDLLWLGIVAKPLYQQGVGHLMADKGTVALAVVSARGGAGFALLAAFQFAAPTRQSGAPNPSLLSSV